MTAHLDWMKSHLSNMVLKILFLPAPKIDLNINKIQVCERIYHSMIGRNQKEVLDFPGIVSINDFLHYLVNEKKLLLHGSNLTSISLLNPLDQENFRGERIKGVYASGDSIWPMYFAIVDLARYRGSLRNGCFVVSEPGGRNKRYYFFSINKEVIIKKPWMKGVIYVLPKDTFYQTSTGVLRFDEWVSEKSVRPIAKLFISPENFPFIDQVSAHNERESIYLSWIMYKSRLKRKSRSNKD